MASSDPDVDDRDPRRAVARRGRKGKTRSGRGRRWGLFRVVRSLLGLVLFVGILGVAVAALLFLYYGSDPNLPSINKISDYRPKQLTRVYDRNGKVIGELGGEKRTVVPFSRIPKVLVNAVVASEDGDFFTHDGFSYRGIARMIFENVLAGRYAQGGSTITQQVVKQMLFTPEKTARRKIQELILSRQISRQLSKEEILEVYLNQSYFGHQVYGCEEAARFYFNKSVSDINVAEAALLAGIVQVPERLSPRKHPEAAKTRQRYALGQMAARGYITRATADKLAAEPITLAPEPPSRVNLAPEIVDAVGRSLRDIHGGDGVATLGGTAKTTVDVRLQELARQSLERGLEDLDLRQGFRAPTGHVAGKDLAKVRADLLAAHKGELKDGVIVEGIVERVDKDPQDSRHGRIFVDTGGQVGVVDLASEARYTLGPKGLAERLRPGDLLRVRAAPERRRVGAKPAVLEPPLALELGPQAAMVVMDPQTREILALVGGYGYRPGGYDRSQRAGRQPGSAFKPFVYAAAIDSQRYTAATRINDAPEVYDLWKPSNYEKETFRGPVRLRVALANSINTVAIKLVADLGLPAVRDMATRAGITSPMPDSLGLSMALGSGSVTPLELANAYSTFVANGQRADAYFLRPEDPIPAAPVAAKPPAIRPDIAFVVVSLLRSVVDEGTARAAGLRIRRPLAGKTGTSNGSKDAWFVGFTPDLLAAVWVGFDDGRRLGKGEAGAKTALPIWIEFMAKALAGRPTRDFAQPPGVTVMRIDAQTGMLPAPGTEGIEEVFLDGTGPTDTAAALGQSEDADKLLLERQP